MPKKNEAELKIPLSYIVIPMVTVIVAALGQHFTTQGLDWYQTIEKPSFTPPGVIISMLWSLIYITTTAAAVMAWEGLTRNREFIVLFLSFTANVCFNVLFSILFFRLHLLAPAVINAVLVHLTSLIVLVILLRRTPQLSVLMLPYAAWSGFVSFLMYQIWLLNS